MKNHPRRDIPPALAEEFDDYVVDAVALANGTLTPQRAAEVRARMESDPIYRAVVAPIVDATHNPVALSPTEMDAQWTDLRKRAGIGSATVDLAAFQERIRARDRSNQRRMMLFAAVLSFLVLVPVVGLTYMSIANFERIETAVNVKSEITLPDGSVAVLAPSSRLKYRTGMVTPLGDLDRAVELRGTADFVVTQRAERQFVVTTKHAHVMVLGTRFRVEEMQNFTLVSVREGEVRAQPLDADGNRFGSAVLLRPGSSARIFSDSTVTTEGPVIPPNPRKSP